MKAMIQGKSALPFLAIAIPHLLTIVLQIDSWPFSYYPMFSKNLTHVDAYQLNLSTPDNNEIRIPIKSGKPTMNLYKLHASNKDQASLAVIMQRDLQRYMTRHPTFQILPGSSLNLYHVKFKVKKTKEIAVLKRTKIHVKNF